MLTKTLYLSCNTIKNAGRQNKHVATRLLMPVKIDDIDTLTSRCFMKRMQHIRFLAIPPQQTQTKNTNAPKALFQLAEVQISSDISVAAFAVADDDARVAPDSAKNNAPLHVELHSLLDAATND
jgi:hypothetical protein